MCMTNEEMSLLGLFNAVTKALLTHTRPLRQVIFAGDRYSLYPVPMAGRHVPVVVIELFSVGDGAVLGDTPVHIMPLIELRTIARDNREQGDDLYNALERDLLISAVRHRWFDASGAPVAIDEATRPVPLVTESLTDADRESLARHVADFITNHL